MNKKVLIPLILLNMGYSAIADSFQGNINTDGYRFNVKTSNTEHPISGKNNTFEMNMGFNVGELKEYLFDVNLSEKKAYNLVLNSYVNNVNGVKKGETWNKGKLKVPYFYPKDMERTLQNLAVVYYNNIEYEKNKNVKLMYLDNNNVIKYVTGEKASFYSIDTNDSEFKNFVNGLFFYGNEKEKKCRAITPRLIEDLCTREKGLKSFVKSGIYKK
ncbi:MAG: hypothetical protein AB7V77_03610 [Candidatus Woesearchaeota archaeon]